MSFSSTDCIVLKMTYDIRDFTDFLTCEVNIIPFFLLASWQELGVNLDIHINVKNCLLVIPFPGKASNKLLDKV